MIPVAFTERMQAMLGEDYEDFRKELEQEKYQALRLNPLKKREDGMGAEAVLAGQKEWPCHLIKKVPWAEYAYYYENTDTPGKHPYHEAGLYYIQEPSAMAPVSLLEARPGEYILDLCAAPGGKSTQIAAQLGGRGLLISNEIHPARAKILSENIERLGIRNACVTNETPDHLADIFVEYFDRILVDAPCSGEGMFRKNEVACEEWSPENVEICGDRQDEILDAASKMLRPGGRLVYSTCTFAPKENEGSISRFLKRHPEFSIVPIDKKKLGVVSKEQDKRLDGVASFVEDPAEGIEGTLRLWPHLVEGEGHFAAVLQKEGEAAEGVETDEPARIAAGGFAEGYSLEKIKKQKEMADFLTFCKENLKLDPEDREGTIFLRFGEQIYLAPEYMPSLKGLKVLRPGLHLGTLKKNRFEPSHALALALQPTEAVHVCNLSSGEDVVHAYLNGQTFPAEGEKGWYLICVDGFSIGWGKLAGGMMKNHYPKGLRKA